VIVLVITGLAVLAAAGELLLTTRIKSPAEQAAQASAPAATQLTATVQRMVLTRTVLAQGVVGAPKEFSPAQAGGPGGTGGDTLGTYGPGTAAGVSAYYQAHGYTAPVITSGTKKHPVRLAFVPLGDVSFVPSLPATVIKMGATVGKAPGSGDLTLALGTPKLTGQLSPSTAGLVRPGMRVTISGPGGGPVRHGRVAWVSHSTASSASISGGLYVKMGITLTRPLPMSLVSQDVSLAIGAARSRGPVLAVPEAAVFAGADGQTYVSKVSGGHTGRVPVRVGLSGSGLVQVIPAVPGALSAGDQVVTGQNFAGAGGTAGLVRPGVAPSVTPIPRKNFRGPG
jgi:hypothetical protein